MTDLVVWLGRTYSRETHLDFMYAFVDSDAVPRHDKSCEPEFMHHRPDQLSSAPRAVRRMAAGAIVHQ